MPGRAATECPVDPAMQPFHLPHLRAAISGPTVGLIAAPVSSSTEGLARLDTDVIQMDNRRSPRIRAVVEHIVLEQSLAEVAAETGVDLSPEAI